MSTPTDIRSLCARAIHERTHLTLGSFPGKVFSQAPLELAERLSPEVVLACVSFIESAPPAHPVNANDEGRPCVCSQCERWRESRRLLALLNATPQGGGHE